MDKKILDKVIVALDFSEEKRALEIVDILNNEIKIFKIGLELFLSCGPKIIEKVKAKDKEVFLDLKLHDIPNTVKKALSNLIEYDIFMTTVHALGGRNMLREAKNTIIEVAEKKNKKRPLIIAVTLLTSLEDEDLKELGIQGKLEDEVLKLAKISKEEGIDGVVSSPLELPILKKIYQNKLIFITPGIRKSFIPGDDQKRKLSLKEAISEGANYVVVGRQITLANDPQKALYDLLD
ncbi:MAG: orotidine-5'-phosphate decarboxylase [Thermovenabulum sp.]|uniref:orotidine-5'-phosphate decarboxylase n=1 Tax=Thermovenabulum sp. TaxID=3100335 RepID=UPI003C7B74B2